MSAVSSTVIPSLLEIVNLLSVPVYFPLIVRFPLLFVMVVEPVDSVVPSRTNPSVPLFNIDNVPLFLMLPEAFNFVPLF